MSARYPALHIDLGLLEENARALISWCGERGIELTAVTKLVESHPEMVKALYRGGVTSFADSHLANLGKLRRTGLPIETMLLRAPMMWEIPRVPQLTEICCASDSATLKLINESAARLKAVVKIILMIELGNLREGVMPQDALGRCREIAGLRNLRLHGVGSIFGCLSATAPTRESLERLVLLRDEIERDLGEEVPVISGGSGSNLKMVMDGEMPGEVNHLRLGEAFFNGVEALHREPIPWLSQNVFRFEAQVLEVYRKPSAPRGVPVMDAFGRYRTFVDRGSEWRILLATGKNEVMTEDLEPLEDGIAIAGATGDQAVAEGGSGPSCRYRPGDVIAFRPAYSAVLKAFNSPHVHKVFKRIRTRYKGRGAE